MVETWQSRKKMTQAFICDPSLSSASLVRLYIVVSAERCFLWGVVFAACAQSVHSRWVHPQTDQMSIVSNLGTCLLAQSSSGFPFQSWC